MQDWHELLRCAAAGAFGLFALLQALKEHLLSLKEMLFHAWVDIHGAAKVASESSPVMLWAQDYLYPALISLWVLNRTPECRPVSPECIKLITSERKAKLSRGQRLLVRDVGEAMYRLDSLKKSTVPVSEGGKQKPIVKLDMERRTGGGALQEQWIIHRISQANGNLDRYSFIDLFMEKPM